MRYDWDRIEIEYIRGKASMEQLAAKYKIPLSTFFKRAKVRKFSEKRREYAGKVQEKAIARAQARDARTLSNLSGALDKAARMINRYIVDEDTLHGRIVNHMDGSLEEVRVKKLDTKALRDMTAALKEASAALRMLNEKADDDERGERAGVILMPERDGAAEGATE